jgi:hypothetical protein
LRFQVGFGEKQEQVSFFSILKVDNDDYKFKSFQRRSSMLKTHHDLFGIISAMANVPQPLITTPCAGRFQAAGRMAACQTGHNHRDDQPNCQRKYPPAHNHWPLLIAHAASFATSLTT